MDLMFTLIESTGYGLVLVGVLGMVLIVGGALLIGAERRLWAFALVVAGAALMGAFGVDRWPDPPQDGPTASHTEEVTSA